MNITPRVAEGADDELVFCEKGEFSLYPNMFFNILPKKLMLRRGETERRCREAFPEVHHTRFCQGKEGRRGGGGKDG